MKRTDPLRGSVVRRSDVGRVRVRLARMLSDLGLVCDGSDLHPLTGYDRTSRYSEASPREGQATKRDIGPKVLLEGVSTMSPCVERGIRFSWPQPWSAEVSAAKPSDEVIARRYELLFAIEDSARRLEVLPSMRGDLRALLRSRLICRVPAGFVLTGNGVHLLSTKRDVDRAREHSPDSETDDTSPGL